MKRLTEPFKILHRNFSSKNGSKMKKKKEIFEKYHKYFWIFLNISPRECRAFLLSHRTQNVPRPPSQVTDSTGANEAASFLHVIYSPHISQCSPTVITNYPISVFLSNHNRIQLSSHELRDSPERKLLHGFHLSCSEAQQPLSYGSRSEARENGGQKGMFLKGCL